MRNKNLNTNLSDTGVGYPGYAAYYAVRGMYLATSNKEWNEWYVKIQPQIINIIKDEKTDTLMKGFALCALGMEKGLLPLFER